MDERGDVIPRSECGQVGESLVEPLVVRWDEIGVVWALLLKARTIAFNKDAPC
jgi:hypothetical protein